jgi:antitoxin VapB
MEVAKLFKNGHSQAVRLPRAYQFEGDAVYIKRMGNVVLLIPMRDSWRTLFDSLEHFVDFPEREQPTEQQPREDLFA